MNNYCNHILGFEDGKLITQSDNIVPSTKFQFCPQCAVKLHWDYLLRKIMFH